MQFALPEDVVLCGAPLVLLVVLAVATSIPTRQSKVPVSRSTTPVSLVGFSCRQKIVLMMLVMNFARSMLLLVGAMRSHAEVLPVGAMPPHAEILVITP